MIDDGCAHFSKQCSKQWFKLETLRFISLRASWFANPVWDEDQGMLYNLSQIHAQTRLLGTWDEDHGMLYNWSQIHAQTRLHGTWDEDQGMLYNFSQTLAQTRLQQEQNVTGADHVLRYQSFCLYGIASCTILVRRI